MLDLEQMDRRAMLRDLDAAIERGRAERRPDLVENCLVGWERMTRSLQADRTRHLGRERDPASRAPIPAPGSGR